jgi:hypothetical protein
MITDALTPIHTYIYTCTHGNTLTHEYTQVVMTNSSWTRGHIDALWY